MPLIKRRKNRDQSSTSSPSSSHKLFVDYPYPIITELAKTYKPQKKSDHLHVLTILQQYKDNFHKLFDQSFRQAHIDRRSSNAMVNDLQKTTEPTGVKRILPSSMSSPLSDQNEQNNNIHLRGKNMLNSTDQNDAD